MIKYREFSGGTSGKIAAKMAEWRSEHRFAHELFHDAFPNSVIITYDEREVTDDEPKVEPTPEMPSIEEMAEIIDEIDEVLADAKVDIPQPKRSPGRPKKIKEAD